MHGSYVGLVVGFVVSYVIMSSILLIGEFSELKPTAFILIFFPLVLGFLAGWSLHSLARIWKG